MLLVEEALRGPGQHREGERHRSEFLVRRSPFVNPGGDHLPQGGIHRRRPHQKP